MKNFRKKLNRAHVEGGPFGRQLKLGEREHVGDNDKQSRREPALSRVEIDANKSHGLQTLSNPSEATTPTPFAPLFQNLLHSFSSTLLRWSSLQTAGNQNELVSQVFL